MENPYLPYPVRIDDIIVESEDRNLKTFKLVFLNPSDEKKFAYQAGQFAELSIAGKGEIPIGIASSPVEKGFIKFTINKAGVVTTHLHNMKVGDVMGVRGPLGNSFPWEAAGRQKCSHCRGRVCFYHPARFHHLHARPGQPAKI